MPPPTPSNAPTELARFWQRLKAFEEVMTMTPLDFLEERVARLERRLAGLESATMDTGAEGESK